MAVRPVVITGEPVLHRTAARVEAFDAELATLVADMFETMDAAHGVGLAAPQVGVGLRLFVYSWSDDDGEAWRGVAINPQLWQTPLVPESVDELDDETESEGCLSIPGERFPLRRAEGVLLRAIDLDGEPYEIEAHGWLARIFQHEFDHLNGLLYVDRLDPKQLKRARKAIRANGWARAAGSATSSSSTAGSSTPGASRWRPVRTPTWRAATTRTPARAWCRARRPCPGTCKRCTGSTASPAAARTCWR